MEQQTKRKRVEEYAADAPPKRQRSERHDADVAAIQVKSNAIIPSLPRADFNSCLGLVFDWLTVSDLTNVAEAHPDFVPAAQRKYQDKFSHLQLSISNGGHSLSIKGQDKLKVTFEALMKHFGHLVFRLKLDYSSCGYRNYAHHWREAEQIIFEHCMETLTQLKLLGCRGNVFEELNKPFGKVTCLRVCGEQPNIFLKPFGRNKWFPKIEKCPVNLADLNEYCLEAIFEHLDVTGLTNMAELSQYFAPVAELVFKRKYSNEYLFITDSGHTIKLGKERLNVTLAVLMKHFGKMIHNLLLSYGESDVVDDSNGEDTDAHHWRQVERLISDHCADSLNYIILSGRYNCGKALQACANPFRNVTDVLIEDYWNHELDSHCRFFWDDFHLDKMFPRIIHLDLDVCNLQPLRLTNNTLKCLNKITMDIPNDAFNVDRDVIRHFLQTNEHIKELTIDGQDMQLDADFLRFLNETLPSLEFLYLPVDMQTFSSVDQMIHFKNVKTSTLIVMHLFEAPIPFRFGCLQSLNIYIDDEYYNDNWINFILQNDKLLELKINYLTIPCFSAQKLFAIVSKLPVLQKFRFPARAIRRGERDIFRQKCSFLKQLTDIQLYY